MQDRDLLKISSEIKDSIDSRVDAISSISEAVSNYTSNSLLESEQALQAALNTANSNISYTYNTLCNAKEILYDLKEKKEKELSSFYNLLETYQSLVLLKSNIYKLLGLFIFSIFLFWQITQHLNDKEKFIKSQCNDNSKISICLEN